MRTTDVRKHRFIAYGAWGTVLVVAHAVTAPEATWASAAILTVAFVSGSLLALKTSLGKALSAAAVLIIGSALLATVATVGTDELGTTLAFAGLYGGGISLLWALPPLIPLALVHGGQP